MSPSVFLVPSPGMKKLRFYFSGEASLLNWLLRIGSSGRRDEQQDDNQFAHADVCRGVPLCGPFLNVSVASTGDAPTFARCFRSACENDNPSLQAALNAQTARDDG